MTHKTIDLCDYEEYSYKNCEEFIAKCRDYLEKVFSSIKELSKNGMNWVEVAFIEYCTYRQSVIDFTTNSVIDSIFINKLQQNARSFI